MKTYLVTGVNGYIGSNLAFNLLKEGNKVIGIGRQDISRLNVQNENFLYLKSDLSNIEYLSKIDKYEFTR